jgi:hypothetical protein
VALPEKNHKPKIRQHRIQSLKRIVRAGELDMAFSLNF